MESTIALLQEGYSIRIHKADGSTRGAPLSTREGTVVLEPDVRQYFSNFSR